MDESPRRVERQGGVPGSPVGTFKLQKGKKDEPRQPWTLNPKPEFRV